MTRFPPWLLALLCLQFVAIARAQSPAGDWQGSIDLPDGALEVRVRLVADSGAFTGTIDIPAQGAVDLPLRGIEVRERQVRFAIAGVPSEPTFAGELTAGGDRLAGRFTQGDAEYPFALTRSAAAAADATAALAGFQQWLDGARGEFEAPGCAVAVVRRGELLATFASGQRDIDAGLPVTADTLFAIGSSTKAFTTALLALLVAEGKLDWDEPVRKWLPEFALADAPLGERITPRDLVTHRSGMPRHDLVWYGATFDRAEMVRRLRYLPLSEDLRAEFQYNNLMYLTAGHLAERIAGASWEELVQQRLLRPLGMVRANFSVGSMQLDADHARPYRKDDGRVGPIPFRDISAIGPAGSINASVRELARWLSLHLGGGEVDDARVLPQSAIADLHAVRMPVPVGPRAANGIVPVGYASGWFVDVYRGHRRVQHGGNIDGFSAMVTLLPDDGFGCCVLANLDGTPLPEMVARQLGDRLLGLPPQDWKTESLARRQQAEGMAKKGKEGKALERRPDAPPSRALAEFAGNYEHPGYGACRVELRDGALRIDFHGLGAGLEHWHFDVFACRDGGSAPEMAGIKIQFTSDFEGEVDGLRVVLEPSVPAIVFARQPDAKLRDPAFLQTLVGDYDLGPMVASCELVGDRLVLCLPGQRHELVPGRGLVFALSRQSDYSIRFVTAADGAIRGLRIRQPEGVFEAPRKPGK